MLNHHSTHSFTPIRSLSVTIHCYYMNHRQCILPVRCLLGLLGLSGLIADASNHSYSKHGCFCHLPAYHPTLHRPEVMLALNSP